MAAGRVEVGGCAGATSGTTHRLCLLFPRAPQRALLSSDTLAQRWALGPPLVRQNIFLKDYTCF